MSEHSDAHQHGSLSREERQRQILAALERDGRVAVLDLASSWQVQPITIRRDLDALSAAGLLIRVRGGALRNERVRLEFGYAERMRQHLAEKQAIARHAAALVESGQTVLLDTGTTTQLIARELSSRTDLQIVTNSLAVGYELRSSLGVRLIVLGGCARPGGIELVGPFTERLLGEIRADIAFLGADAVDASRGFYTTDPGVARVEELMVEAAARAVVTATADKLSRRAFVRYASFGAVDRWITCGDIDVAQRRRLGDRIRIDQVVV